jgi:hypothetical protein
MLDFNPIADQYRRDSPHQPTHLPHPVQDTIFGNDRYGFTLNQCDDRLNGEWPPLFPGLYPRGATAAWSIFHFLVMIVYERWESTFGPWVSLTTRKNGVVTWKCMSLTSPILLSFVAAATRRHAGCRLGIAIILMDGRLVLG